MAHKKEYTEEETNFIKEHYPLKGGAWCANILNKKNYNVTNFAKRLGLIYAKRPNIDMELLSNITDKNLIYLLGFWWADASLSTKSLFLEITKTDSPNILESYKAICEYSLYFRPKRGNDKETITIMINQKTFCSWLIEHDYNIKSTCEPVKVLEKIPKKYHYLWWRGFFDGDGHIRVCKKGRYSFNLSGNICLTWDSVTTLLNTLEIKYSLHRTNKLKSRYSAIICQNTDGFLKFFSYIYENRDNDNIGLLRKYEKFKEGLTQIKMFKEGSFRGMIPITLIDIHTNLSHSFRSIKEASQYLNINISDIYNARRKNKTIINNKWIVIYNN